MAAAVGAPGVVGLGVEWKVLFWGAEFMLPTRGPPTVREVAEEFMGGWGGWGGWEEREG